MIRDIRKMVNFWNEGKPFFLPFFFFFFLEKKSLLKRNKKSLEFDPLFFFRNRSPARQMREEWNETRKSA